MAQQQSGQQQYEHDPKAHVADIKPGSEIYKRTHGEMENSQIGSGECVDACKHFAGLPASSQWKAGPKVMDKPNLEPGTAIATFNNKGLYPQTDVPKNSAIYLGRGARGRRVAHPSFALASLTTNVGALPFLVLEGWATTPASLWLPLLHERAAIMPTRLARYQHTGNFHFLTFSCYRRQPLFAASSGYEIFEQELEKVRQRHGFVVAGYVVMPEHVHVLVSEPRTVPLSVALQVLKQQVSRKLKRPGDIRFWQRRYYDFNVWNHDKTVEKLKYMHRNPVRRGLVPTPQDWPWSSFLHSLTGETGTVEIESHWTAWRREHPQAFAPPTLPKTGEG